MLSVFGRALQVGSWVTEVTTWGVRPAADMRTVHSLCRACTDTGTDSGIWARALSVLCLNAFGTSSSCAPRRITGSPVEVMGHKWQGVLC